jgi:hypothetical protein
MSGILVMFETEQALTEALQHLQPLRVGELKTYTPKPLELEPPNSPIPFIVLAGGLLGAGLGFFMQYYANAFSYPLDIGGRPINSWPAYIPVTFEIAVLSAVVAGIFGYFALNRMPRLYDPIDELDSMREAMRDGWLVAIHTEDPDRITQARSIVEEFHPIAIERFSS